MGYIAVVDTETNWHDQVMSIGVVIADRNTLLPKEGHYWILDPEYLVGGMYDGTLMVGAPGSVLCRREQMLQQLRNLLVRYGVESLYAYNASFDRNHLPELRCYRWHDIMRLAAYRQHNPKIGPWADCCSTGRLKRGYGVEPMLRLLSGASGYSESHNALQDALDELEIMRLLGHRCEDYPPL